MGRLAAKKLSYFIAGFTGAFVSKYEDTSFKRPRYYMSRISDKRREEFKRNEEGRSRKEITRHKRKRIAKTA